jgi:hypothetical protein
MHIDEKVHRALSCGFFHNMTRQIVPHFHMHRHLLMTLQLFYPQIFKSFKIPGF